MFSKSYLLQICCMWEWGYIKLNSENLRKTSNGIGTLTLTIKKILFKDQNEKNTRAALVKACSNGLVNMKN